MRESWTDQRLDKFAADTARRFDGVDKRFDKIEGRLDGIDTRFDMLEHSMSDRFDRLAADMRELQSQSAAFQRTFLQVSGGAFIAFVVSFIGVITQL